MIYLDYAATTPVHKEVQEVIHYHLAETFGNPSSNYPVGQAAHEVLEQSRQQIAATIGVRASEVIFTSGATEADNWAVLSQARRARELGRGDHLVSTRIEHPAVMEALAQLEREGFQVTYLEPEDQEYRLEAFQAATTDQTTGWIAMAVNNEVGSRLPVEVLGQAALDQGLWFHTDTAQAINNLALNLADLPCTSCVIAGHKLYAPKGIGVLVYRPQDAEMVLEPQVIGGGQEGGLRSGTENIP